MPNEKRRESSVALGLGIFAGLCTATSGIRRVVNADTWTAAAVSGLVIAVASVLVILLAIVVLHRQRRSKDGVTGDE